ATRMSGPFGLQRSRVEIGGTAHGARSTRPEASAEPGAGTAAAVPGVAGAVDEQAAPRGDVARRLGAVRGAGAPCRPPGAEPGAGAWHGERAAARTGGGAGRGRGSGTARLARLGAAENPAAAALGTVSE